MGSDRPNPNTAGAAAQRLPIKENGALVVGRLIAHGRDHYQGRKDKDLSYFVRVLTSSGKTRTFWGKGLDSAIHSGVTRPKIGDMVGVRRVEREPITRFERVKDAAGRVVGEIPLPGYRSRWQVEVPKFFSDTARAARLLRDRQSEVREALSKQPELKSAFLSLRAATLKAEQQIADPAERERFLKLIKETMAASIQRGEPLPEVRLNQNRRPAKTRDEKPATERTPRKQDKDYEPPTR